MTHGIHLHKKININGHNVFFSVCKNALPHWKFVFKCFVKCHSLFIPGLESNSSITVICLKINVHAYRLVLCGIVHYT